MNNSTVNTFVTELRKTKLLDAPQLEVAKRLGQKATRPAEVASELIKRGWITPYQANQVARGRGGELVLGSYVILEPLAKGGMGQVLKARHRYMQRHVALKFIRTEQRDSADLVQRFQREVQLLAEMRHPHIVTAYDAGNIGDTWFLAMELLDGIDLDRLVQKQGPLPVGPACEYIRQAALGLQHAHEKGLVHRDIKPSNLFLTGEGIKVLDLGLARPQSISDATQPGDLTRANTVMGTPDYLAPEQALDPRRAGTRSDLYSLGCTLYFLLTGKPPFPEGTLAQKLLYHQQAEPTPLEEFRLDIPAEVAKIIRQMLAKAPQQRPANAAAIAELLSPHATRAPTAVRHEAQGGRAMQTDVKQVAASLVDAKAPAPERGFTLTTESLPPTPAASLIDAKADTPEQGFTLVTESLPPTPASSITPSNSETSFPTTTHPLTTAQQHWTKLSSAHRHLAIALGTASVTFLLLLFIVGVVWIGRAIFFRPHVPGDLQAAESKKTPDSDTTPKEKPVIVIPKSDDKEASSMRLPQEPLDVRPTKYLQPTGPKETENLFVMPTIAPDAKLANCKAGDKIFLSDLNEFAFKTSPLGWKFAKDGRVGDPRDPNSRIMVNGTTYPKGLGMHPPNTGYIRICYALAGQCRSLHGSVALDDGDHPPWSIKTTYFVVIGDGKVLWRSQGIKDRGVIEPFKVDVRDVAVLELRVYTDYNGANGSRAVWLDPYAVAGTEELSGIRLP